MGGNSLSDYLLLMARAGKDPFNTFDLVKLYENMMFVGDLIESKGHKTDIKNLAYKLLEKDGVQELALKNRVLNWFD